MKNLPTLHLPGNLIPALSNTLIQSLWQGLILAAIAGIIVILTRKAAATTRYKLLVGSLGLFTMVTVYTFVSQVQNTGSYITALNEAGYPSQQNNIKQLTTQQALFTTQIPTNSSLKTTLVSYFNEHAGLIVTLWFLIVCARSLQLLTGLYTLKQLRKHAIFNISADWQQRVNTLSQNLGIKRVVQIAQSHMAKVPMVMGHIKPVILLPVGLITTLAPAEIEAILVHELAHISRRDYLVNLLQSFMEIVFFFNPAVLWISALIKTERENCCDDIAVAQTSGKVNYIRALVSCQEYYMAAPAYAMALGGEKNHLVGRVKRMVSNNNRSLNMAEKALLATCLLTAGLLTTAFNNTDKINKLIATTTKAVAHVSEAVKHQIIAPKTVEQTAVENLKTDTNRRDTAKLNKVVADKKILDAIKKENDDLVMHKEMFRLDSIKAEVHAQPHVNVNLGNMNVKLGKLGKVDTNLSAIKIEANPAYVAKPAYVAQPAYIAQSAYVTPPAYVAQKAEYANTASTYKKDYNETLADKLIAELIKDGIIAKREANLSFKISNKEFIVNGVVQSDKIYQKYRAEYVPKVDKGDWAWMYNFDEKAKVTHEQTVDSSKP